MRRYGPGPPVWKGLSIGAIVTLVQFGIVYPALFLWLAVAFADRPEGNNPVALVVLALASFGLCVRFLWDKFREAKAPPPGITPAPAKLGSPEPEASKASTLPPVRSIEYCPKGNAINPGVPCHECSQFECRDGAR